MVVRVFLVEVPVQEGIRDLCHMRVARRLDPVMLELVRGKADADRRTEGPAQQAGGGDPETARARHSLTVEKSWVGVKGMDLGRGDVVDAPATFIAMVLDVAATPYSRPEEAQKGPHMTSVHGLHHVTAISGPAQENLDFYAGVLGMRLVKKSVNQDDPGTYHLFYADATGRPGTDLTFFPWPQLAPPRPGHGTAPEVSLAVPPGALDYWFARLERYGAPVGEVSTRFGERALPFQDPHGMHLALVESESAFRGPFTPWQESTVESEHQIRGLDGARMRERELRSTTSFLESALGFRLLASENGWERWVLGDGGSGKWLDLAEAPADRRGAWGVGAIHHLAFRVKDGAEQLEVRSQVAEQASPTPVIDRFWFHSVYFKEPGGVLFELATDGPGFTADEDLEHLGEKLVLPPWLESERPEIEAKLPALSAPAPIVGAE